MLEQGGLILTALSVAFWVWAYFFRGGFWRADQRLDDAPSDLQYWPGIVAVIPARNEAETIGQTVASLLAQDYPGDVSVIVVDDGSDDGTAEATGTSERLSVIRGKILESGWTGKLWAMKQGLQEADRTRPSAPFVLLTDADIVHDPASLRRLVAKAEEDNLDLVSLIALLRCENFWELLLIPAFIFFFQNLFPFPWVNDPSRPAAAAAGGCVLVRRRALLDAGGVDAICGRLIDDCALAANIKKRGPIWLGLTEKVRSLRRYDSLAGIWCMVARTAFEQLGNSALLLIGAVLGMGVAYLVPPLASVGILGGGWMVMVAGLITWLGLAGVAYAPTLRLYGLSFGWILALPLAALLFTLMTFSSAIRHWQGRGSTWKGRSYGATSTPNR